MLKTVFIIIIPGLERDVMGWWAEGKKRGVEEQGGGKERYEVEGKWIPNYLPTEDNQPTTLAQLKFAPNE